MASSSGGTQKDLSNSQALWDAASENIISSVVQCISNENTSFISVFRFLASERQRLAKKFGHEHNGTHSEGSAPFGRLSAANRVNYESHNSMPDSARPLLEKLVSSQESDERSLRVVMELPVACKIRQPSPDVLTEIISIAGEHDRVSDANYLRCHIEENIRDNQPIRLSTINIEKDTLNFELNYPDYDKYSMSLVYACAQQLYEQMLFWRQGQDIQDFLNSAAELSYLMAHTMPVDRGLQSMMEWMVTGIARQKGIDRFPVSPHKEGVPWSWAALLEPDVEQYKQWYADAVLPQVKKSAERSQNKIEFSTDAQTEAGNVYIPPPSFLRKNAFTLTGAFSGFTGFALIAVGLLAIFPPAGLGLADTIAIVASAALVGGLIGIAAGYDIDKKRKEERDVNAYVAHSSSTDQEPKTKATPTPPVIMSSPLSSSQKSNRTDNTLSQDNTPKPRPGFQCH